MTAQGHPRDDLQAGDRARQLRRRRSLRARGRQSPI